MSTRKLRKLCEGTGVAAVNSQAEIRKLLEKHGATSFGLMETAETSCIVCCFQKRNLKFDVSRKVSDAEYRRLWRVVVMRVKIRLEEVSGGDSTVDEAFMQFIVLPNGRTVGESVLPAIGNAYAGNGMATFLLEYKQ